MKYKDNMIEGYLDNNQEYYDYGTEFITDGDIIDTHHTGTSYYDQFLDPSQTSYLKDTKNLVGDIVYMSPTEYYENCAKKIFNSSVDHLKKTRKSDVNTINKLKTVIQHYKRKLCLPMLNYADQGQEGLHRMYVIGELYGWDYKVPVLVVDWYDKERAENAIKEKKKREIDRRVESAIDKALRYKYRDEAEVKDQLQWELDRSFEFYDAVETPVEFNLESLANSLILHLQDYEYPIDKDDLKWVDDTEDDLDDIEIEDIDDWIQKYLGPNWKSEFPDAKDRILKNESLEDSQYVRFEVVDENGNVQGGLFRGLNQLLKNMWDEDNYLYDELNEPLSKLEYITPYPENIENSKTKFAYSHKFYKDNIELFNDIESVLNELGWTIKNYSFNKPSNIVYEDDIQIAYQD